MIKPIVEGTRVVFGPCRLSYVHLFEKYNPDNIEGGGKYCANVLIPETETQTIKAIEKAIEAAKQEGLNNPKKWAGVMPRKFESPLRRGDEKENAGEEFDGCLYVNAKSNRRPGVVDKNRSPIMDEEDVYSGMWAVVCVSFFPYNTGGNKGVGCALNNVMKTRDDERLGGSGRSAESDFAAVQFDDDDDL